MKKIILLLSVVMGMSNSYALPLLSESAALNLGTALTLYPDHQDKNKFYFFPNSSAMARDNSNMPLFGFTYWGLDSGSITDAGAYMSFTARLKSDKDQKQAIEKFMQRNPNAGVTMLPLVKSTLGIQSTKAQPTPLGMLFDEFNISTVGGIGESEIGVNAILTGIGAKVFKKAILNPALLKLDYCYSFEGLGPNMDAKITLKWKRVYDHFRTSFTVGHWWTKATITREVEKLKQTGAVRVEINGGDAKDEEYIQHISEKMVKRLFVPELQMRPGATEPRPSGWSFTTFNLGSTHREELKEEVYTLVKRDLVERSFCNAVSLRDIKKHYDDVVQNADDNENFSPLNYVVPVNR